MKIDRRTFFRLTGTAGAGLLLGVGLRAESAATLAPDAFLQIATSGDVTIWIPRQEMGQGVRTSLAMLVAEELDADWSTVSVLQAPLDAKYGAQRTGGSLSIRELWEPLRKTGATARHILVETAAERWGVPAARLETRDSVVRDRLSGEQVPYSALVADAARRPVPEKVALKDVTRFRLIGKDVPRIDGPEVVGGRATYGVDVRRPGMLFASFERCPVIGGKVRSFDGTAAERVPGVRAVLPIDGTSASWLLQWSKGVAVVADSTWAAMEGRRALSIEWDEGPNVDWTQERIVAELAEGVAKDGTVTRNDGDLDAAFSASTSTIRADYLAPYLAHAPLEPMNCVVDVREDGCDVWAPCQFPNIAQAIVARVTGLDASNVRIHPTLMGGAFGRRIYADWAGEAALISKHVGRPVQLLWTRADDMKHGFYRPISHHRLEATLGEDGTITGWRHRMAGPSRDAVRGPDVETPERSEVYAANEMPYAVPSVRVEFHHVYVPIPCGPWRAVAYSQTGFVVESFIDELAQAAGCDPVAFRVGLLTRQPFSNNDTLVEPQRMRRVLEHAAQQAGWKGRSIGVRRGRGIAITADHGTAVAHVADVSVDRDGRVTVERIVTAIDCGIAVHPGMIRAQVEGAVAMALSATLKGEITIDRGRVAQSSYADYDVVRMSEMPRVEVHILPSTAPPGGVGEPPLPGVAPAVANAIFGATGIRVRTLPVRSALLSSRAHARDDRSVTAGR